MKTEKKRFIIIYGVRNEKEAQYEYMAIVFFAAVLVASAMVIAGCGGGSGGGSAATSDTTITTDVAEGLGGDGSETISRGSTSTTPLEIASRVSVVDSTESAQRYGGNEFAKSVMRLSLPER